VTRPPGDRKAVAIHLRAAGCVFAEEEARLLVEAAAHEAELADMVRRRTAGLPLEVILGWAEFAGLRVAVDPGVFVPRRRSEALARHAVGLVRPGAMVADLCCGSGALGLVVATRVSLGALYAVDCDPRAVTCARRNIEAVGGRVLEGDLYSALPGSLRGRVDMVVVNAPYVPTGEIALLPREAREHEPRVALDGGPDGCDVQRLVAAGAVEWLAPGGHVLMETSERQAPLSAAALASHGLSARVLRSSDGQALLVEARMDAAGAS
jgi:release factor glutamine methyltransferase